MIEVGLISDSARESGRWFAGLETSFDRIVARSAVLPAILLTVAMTIIAMAFTRGPLTADISGQLWFARQIRMGARLYIDIPEINPPLWFWAALPMDWLREMTGLRAEVYVVAAAGFATVISLIATGRLLGDLSPKRRGMFLIYAALMLFLMPIRDVGQREQYALIWALPYVVLAVVRWRGRAVSRWLALFIGAAAGLGFALKHYFLGVPVMIEIWLILGLRRTWWPVRPETLALAASGFGYAALVLIIAPEYLADMVPQLRFAYAPMGMLSWWTLLLPAPVVCFYLLRLIAPRHLVLRKGGAPLTMAFLIAAAGFLLAFLLQGKGWQYHFIPISGFIALAFFTSLFEGGDDSRPKFVAVAPLVLPFLLAIIPTHPTLPPKLDIMPMLEGLNHGDPVALIATEGPFIWPGAVDKGFLYSSRYLQYWMLAAIDFHHEGDHDPRADRLGRKIIAQTVFDFKCAPPKRIIFARLRREPNVQITEDPLAYFMNDAGFSNVMSHYRLSKRNGIFDAYDQVTSIGDRPAAGCRRIFAT